MNAAVLEDLSLDDRVAKIRVGALNIGKVERPHMAVRAGAKRKYTRRAMDGRQRIA